MMLMDEPEDPFDPAAWHTWRREVEALPDTTLNKVQLLEQADAAIRILTTPRRWRPKPV